VSGGDLPDELVHGPRVVHLDLGSSPAEVLQLAEKRDVSLEPLIETLELIGELLADAWNNERDTDTTCTSQKHNTTVRPSHTPSHAVSNRQ